MMSKSDWMSCVSLMIRVASLRKSGLWSSEALGKRGRARGMEHGRASAKLIRLAVKAIKDQHRTEEANGRLAAEL
jgi:hypothetical protein